MKKPLVRLRAAVIGGALALSSLALVPAAANAADPVAQIGENTYETLGDAIDAVPTDGTATITMLNNVEITDEIVRIDDNRNITLNLNGRNIGFTADSNRSYFEVQNATLSVSGSGTIRETREDQYGAIVVRGNTDGSVKSRVIVGDSVTLEGWAPVFVTNTSASNKGIEVEVYGILQSTFHNGSGFYVNGTVTDPVNLYADGATFRGGSHGLYLAGNVNATIENSTVSGTNVGIEIRAGVLELLNTKVTGGDGTPNVGPNGSGSTGANTALQIAQHTTMQQIAVTVAGGTFNGGAAVQIANPEENTDFSSDVAVDLQDGTFIGEVISTNASGEAVTGFINGGSFDSVPAPEFVNESAALLVSSGGESSQVLSPAEAAQQAAASVVIDGKTVYFESLEDADEAANDSGEDVTVLRHVAFADGTTTTVVTVSDGAVVAEPSPAPTRAGFTFVGWYVNGSDWDFTQPVTSDLVAQARWTPTSIPTSNPAADVVDVAFSVDLSKLTREQSATITVNGLAPRSRVDAYLFSTPVSLGSAVANASGVATIQVTIPANTPLGTHHLVLIGLGSDNSLLSSSTQVLVVEGLAATGAEVGSILAIGGLLLGVGTGLLLYRRKHPSMN